jgi:hypothetical protein
MHVIREEKDRKDKQKEFLEDGKVAENGRVAPSHVGMFMRPEYGIPNTAQKEALQPIENDHVQVSRLGKCKEDHDTYNQPCLKAIGQKLGAESLHVAYDAEDCGCEVPCQQTKCRDLDARHCVCTCSRSCLLSRSRQFLEITMSRVY